MRKITAVLALGVAAAAIATTAARAQTTPPPFVARNVVLVHGAFADGSSWSDVVAKLQAMGLRVTAVQNPLTSLADDVAATRRALALQDGPTVLVGHSYGGVVISEAGVDPKVAALVFVAALAPDAAEAFGDLAAKFPTPAGQASIKASGGYAALSEEGFVTYFAPDVPKARALAMAASQGPIEATLFDQKTSVAAWKTKPSWYAVSSRDQIIAPEMERFLAERMKATTIELDAGHASPVSRPREIADLIAAAARGAR